MKKTSLFILIAFLLSQNLFGQIESGNSFAFSVTADTRMFAGMEKDSDEYFAGVLKAMKRVGAGEFLISPGDIDPPQDIRWSLNKYLGDDFIWYPVVGNHELDKPEYISYLREYNINGDKLPYIVNKGPEGTEETTYSFDFGKTHFVILNQYYDGSCDDCLDGNISEALFNWLEDDLSKTDKTHIFVVGHEPAFPQPDTYNFRFRHEYDSLNKYPNNRDKFWNLLVTYNVDVYLCGHTHDFNITNINGVWQVDAGHARGSGDTGTPSTFLIFEVGEKNISLNVYRDIHDGFYNYNDIVKSIKLK